MFRDPSLIYSSLCRTVTIDCTQQAIVIFRYQDDSEWQLEILDEDDIDAFTVWEYGFTTEDDALKEALQVLEQEGLNNTNE